MEDYQQRVAMYGQGGAPGAQMQIPGTNLKLQTLDSRKTIGNFMFLCSQTRFGTVFSKISAKKSFKF